MLWAATVALTCVWAGAEVELLPGTSSDDHLWVVVPDGEVADQYRLMHHARESAGPYIRSLRTLTRRPEALAAWDDRLWLVFSAQTGGPREVFTLRMQPIPGLGGYGATPPDRLEVLPAVPRRGRLAGLVGSADGLVALLVPSDAPPELHRLESGTWRQRDLPALAEGEGEWRLTRYGGDLMVLGRVRDRPGRTRVGRLDPGGRWRQEELALDLEQVRSMTRVGPRPLVVEPAGPSSFRLSYLRPGRLIPLASLPAPDTAWTALGLADGVRIISLAPTRGPSATSLRVRPIDARLGTAGEEQAMRAPRVAGSQLWPLSFLLALAVTLALVVLVFRPVSRKSVELPPEVALLSPVPRLAALVIDLLPGVGVSMLMYGATPADLTRAPMFVADLHDSAPYLVMVGVCFAHSTITECLTRRTLGKALVGGCVAAVDGSPRRALLLLRNIVKLLVLILPPLALLVLVTPHLQGVHDLFARTVVVGSAKRDRPSPPEDSRGGR